MISRAKLEPMGLVAVRRTEILGFRASSRINTGNSKGSNEDLPRKKHPMNLK